MDFVRFRDEKTGKPALIPKGVEIVAIRADEGSTGFWLEYIWHVSADGKPSTRSILVSGPVDDILESLAARATGSDKALIQRNEELLQICADKDRAVRELQRRTEELSSLLAHTETLDGNTDWSSVNALGIPTMYSSKRIIAAEFEKSGRSPDYVRFFASSVGQWDASYKCELGYAYTNIRESGRVPGGQAIRIFGVKVELIQCSDAFAAWLKSAGILQWDFMQTTSDIAPLGAFDWDSTGRVGYTRLGLTEEEAQLGDVDTDSTIARQVLPTTGSPLTGGSRAPPPALWGLPPVSAPTVLTKYPVVRLERTGIQLPGNASFAVLLHVDAHGLPAELRHETAGVRISLAGHYLSVIELG